MCTQCRANASDVAAEAAPTADGRLPSTSRRTQRLLAVDVGRVRIGLATAVADDAARPLDVLRRQGTRVDGARIVAQLDRFAADVVVVGLPPQGHEPANCSARLARQFAQALAAMQPRAVVLVDEAGTSVEADDQMRQLGLRAARRRRVIDKVAAAQILTRYLDGAPAIDVPPPSAP